MGGELSPQKLRVSPEPAVVQIGPVDALREPVQRQLVEILASPAFRNSKRYSALLKYLVERTLAGQAAELKERNIGVDVFDRPADYDTTTDHVVRSAGGEIRKRLAQYYMECGLTAEVRVDLHPGSYVPQFRLRRDEFPDTANTIPPAVVNTGIKSVELGPQSVRRWPVLLGVFSAGALLALAAALLVTHRPQTAVDRFWAPITAPPAPVLLCVGRWVGPPGSQRDAGESPSAGRPADSAPGMFKPPIGAEDAIALARMAGTLQSLRKDFRVLTERETTFDDLRQGPAVLIGAINNSWVLRLTSALRFRFEDAAQDQEPFIGESQTASPRAWRSERNAESRQMTRDYAIVARCWNPETSQIVVVAAGSHPWGTRAAGEFLTNPVCLKELEALAQKNGNRKNVELVLSTDIVKGATGPPTMVAWYFW